MPEANDVQRGRETGLTRVLQRKLYRTAKLNRNRRFHALYDKVCRTDILWRAWREVARHAGAAGVDGVTIQAIEEAGVEAFLRELQEELVEGRYRPQPVRRVTIPKRSGGERHLGVPTVRDRVVQAAVKLVIEPIFEADFADCSFGFRPRRSARQARERIRTGLRQGRRWVVDADIRGFFDHLDHGLVLALVRERVCDRRILKLLAGWLRGGILVGGSLLHPTAGTPQGGVISPLLANVVLNRLDQSWQPYRWPLGELTRYADDLVILCGSEDRAQAALAKLRELLTELALELATAKTRVVDCRTGTEGFDFLGYHFRWIPTRRDRSRKYAACWPSKAAVAAARNRIRDLTPTARIGLPAIVVVGNLNAFLRGWGAYFRHGNSTKAFRAIDRFVFERMARFIARKHGSRTWKRGMVDLIDSQTGLGIYQLAGTVRYAGAHAGR
jgi:RNA-directed DNA polymerase